MVLNILLDTYRSALTAPRVFKVVDPVVDRSWIGRGSVVDPVVDPPGRGWIRSWTQKL